MKTKLLITGMLLVLFACSGYAQGTWTRKADFGGVARTEATGFTIGDKIYLGLGNNGPFYKDFWEYDPATDKWTKKADFGGDARAEAVGFSINGKGYIGIGWNGNIYFKDFWEYDPATDKWTKKADFGGTARGFSTGFTIGNKGFIGAGFRYDTGTFSDVWEYDPVTNKWTRKADFGGGGRSNPTSFSIGNKGYMGVGWSGGWNRDFWEYDPATDKWTRKADFGGSAREWVSSFAIGNKGYIGLGHPTSLKDFWEYNPATDKWTRKADFGGAGRAQAVGVSIGNKGYFGTVSGASRYNDFWEYTPDAITTGVPTISSFTPTSGPVGTSVAITGTNFSATSADNIVYFGATKATVTSANATSLTVTVPGGATYEPITVTTNSLTGYSAAPFIVTFEGGGVIDANSFAAAVNYQMGSNPNHLKLADLDGDGKSDMIATSYGDPAPRPQNSVSIFRNTGQSGIISFASKIELLKGGGYTNVTVADFDGDGRIDLAVRDSYYEKLYIFRNTSSVGAISFAEKVEYPTGYFPWDICAGDVDGDGKPDIAVVNWDYTFSVFRNVSANGSISFEPRINILLSLKPLSIAMGDLDKDGKIDIVVGYVDYNNNLISVFKNTSNPSLISFDAKIDLPNISDGYTSGISIGDLDGDDNPDLTVSNLSNGASTISVFRNTGGYGVISFAPKISYKTNGTGYQNSSINDLDGDGKPDITGSNYFSNSISIIKNQSTAGNLSFAQSVNYETASGPYGICTGDLDGDGKPDISFVNLFSGTISVLRNQIVSVSCPPPYGLIVTNLTDSSARLGWVLPGTTVTGYMVRYRPVGASYAVKERLVKPGASHLSIKNLMPNTAYKWKIRSVCTDDVSNWEDGPNFTTTSAIAAIATGGTNIQATAVDALLVKPNPNNGNFTLQMQLPDKAAPATLRLYNSQGNKVWQQQLGSSGGTVQQTISLNNILHAGVYLLVVERADTRMVQKIVVTK